MSAEIIVRKARTGDLEAFDVKDNHPSFRGLVGEKDGEPVMIGGIARGGDGRWYAFFDIRDEARYAKKLIVKTARKFFEDLDVRYVYASVDENEKNARAWMERLGFRLDPRSQTLMRWEGKR